MLYTNKSINLISLILTIIIFCVFYFNISKPINEPTEKIFDIVSSIVEKVKDDEEDKKIEEEQIDLGNWYIEIPSINLKAPINEGTSVEVLNTKVGHFEDTAIQDGNIGLAAHNRGYEYNFFKNLKDVNIDDEIIYTYGEFKRTFSVDTIEIIENTDWTYLENSEENKITLITCVDNEPKFRRCVQATEI
jgi:LPXTG-site transpeptidase (sortase) family protein